MSITSTGLGVFGGVAGLGLIAVAWKTIKLYASKIYGVFVVRMRLDGWPARRAMMLMLWHEFKSSPLSSRTYFAGTSYVQPTQRNQLVAYQNLPGEATVFWRGWRPLVVSLPANDDDTSPDAVHVSFIRGIYSPDKLMIEMVEKLNNRNGYLAGFSGRYYVRRYFGSVGMGFTDKDEKSLPDETASTRSQAQEGYRPLKWTEDQLGQPEDLDAIEALALSAQCLQVLEEARLWRKSEEWHKERGIPWKRGWLLHGIAGTGKTAFCRALGQDLKMPICVFDLASMTNRDFLRSWEDTLARCPCIALFEDLDLIFDGRTNITPPGLEKPLTFDCFLNSLDGVQNSDGVFVAVTTNDLSKMDPAIGQQDGDVATRPGRIDRVIEMIKPDKPGRLKMARRILVDYPETHRYMVNMGSTDTGAQFQDRCATLALKLRWRTKDGDNGKSTMTRLQFAKSLTITKPEPKKEKEHA